MKTTIFQSFLATFLNQFVQYKRALNRKYHTDSEILRLLDRYIHSVRITEWQTIDGSVIDDFIRSRPRVSACSYNQLLGVLRRFFNLAVMQEWIQSSPVTARPRRITGTRIPGPPILPLRGACSQWRGVCRKDHARGTEGWFTRRCSLCSTGWDCGLEKWHVSEAGRCRPHRKHAVDPGYQVRQDPDRTLGSQPGATSQTLCKTAPWHLP